MPHRNLADLTEVETLKLRFAQEHLKHCALIYGTKPDDCERADLLYSAAREFSATCDAIGFTDYWRELLADLHPCCPD